MLLKLANTLKNLSVNAAVWTVVSLFVIAIIYFLIMGVSPWLRLDERSLAGDYVVFFPNSSGVSITRKSTGELVLGPRVRNFGISGTLIIGEIQDPMHRQTVGFYIIDTVSHSVWEFASESDWMQHLLDLYGLTPRDFRMSKDL